MNTSYSIIFRGFFIQYKNIIYILIKVYIVILAKNLIYNHIFQIYFSILAFKAEILQIFLPDIVY